MGWLIAVGILILLAVLPIGFRLIYSQRGPMAWLLVGPIRFRLMKGSKKQKSPPEKKPVSTAEQTQNSRKSGGSLTDFIPIAEQVLKLLNNLRRKLRVDMLEFKLVLAGSDPADLAVNYGRTCAGIGNLVPLMEQYFVIKKRDVDVQCDFTADKTLIYVRLDISITVGRLIALVVKHGIGLLREFLKVINKRKGGAKV